jgi:light-regulated signal transduction histidine kinase (bacteriophytochrome)
MRARSSGRVHAREVSEMFRRKAGNEAAGGGTALAVRPAIVDTSQVVRAVGERMAQKLWPIKAEVHLSCPLPPVKYPEQDFWRLVETLLGLALNAYPSNDSSPQALVGASGDEHTVFFSVHSMVSGAFKTATAYNGLAFEPEFRVSEARDIVSRNGGRFWVDGRFGEGSTAYFTIKN